MHEEYLKEGAFHSTSNSEISKRGQMERKVKLAFIALYPMLEALYNTLRGTHNLIRENSRIHRRPQNINSRMKTRMKVEQNFSKIYIL